MENSYFVHESSFVDEGVRIGAGSKIWHFCHLMTGCRVGKECTIGQNVVISPGVILGNGVEVQNNVSLYSGLICEDDVFLGPSMVFTNVTRPRAFIERQAEFKTTVIQKGASIGANVTVVCGNNIGRYALVGAGSLVSSDIPDYALVYGNPAHFQGWVCQCGGKLTFYDQQSVCEVCNLRYKQLRKHKIREDL